MKEGAMMIINGFVFKKSKSRPMYKAVFYFSLMGYARSLRFAQELQRRGA
jgi:hypothetical protein